VKEGFAWIGGLVGYSSGLIGEEGKKNNTLMPIVQTARQD
jgi:hypothetical protein